MRSRCIGGYVLGCVLLHYHAALHLHEKVYKWDVRTRCGYDSRSCVILACQ